MKICSASFAVFALLFATAAPMCAQLASKEVDTVYPEAHALYVDLHQHPELSSHEVQTGAKLAAALRKYGYEVTEHVGGTGIVAIMRNGTGPTVMLRTELDALPVQEKTGLTYASTVHAKNDSGEEVAVMHACGRDLHMASLVATAEIMARTKETWHPHRRSSPPPAGRSASACRARFPWFAP